MIVDPSEAKVTEIRENIISLIVGNTGLNYSLNGRMFEEDGNTLSAKQYPAGEVIYVEDGPGLKESNAFIDTKYTFAIRYYTDVLDALKGKKELIKLAEPTKALILKNYRLNGACWNSKWVGNKYTGKITKNGKLFSRFADVIFDFYAFLPRF